MRTLEKDLITVMRWLEARSMFTPHHGPLADIQVKMRSVFAAAKRCDATIQQRSSRQLGYRQAARAETPLVSLIWSFILFFSTLFSL